MSETKSDYIFICGGGTGGHFFSGLAFAEKIVDLYPEKRIIFVGTRNGIEARHQLTDSRMKTEFISSRGLKGKGLLQKIFGALAILVGIFQSFRLLLKYRPSLVAGVGGYASAPTVFSAAIIQWLISCRVMILDQNSSVGLANKLFSFFPGVRAFCAFKFPRFETVDLPVRRKIEEAAKKARPPVWPPKHIFVLGGSQGAKGLNSKWLNEVLPSLHREFPKIEFSHQTGAKEMAEVKSAYQKLGILADVFAFSDQMERYYDQADLIVCRSGAMTVFEVIAFKRPSAFVPFPAATDDHQYKNAIAVQAPDWVIREADLSEPRVEKILKSAQPFVPHRILIESTEVKWKGLLEEIFDTCA